MAHKKGAGSTRNSVALVKMAMDLEAIREQVAYLLSVEALLSSLLFFFGRPAGFTLWMQVSAELSFSSADICRPLNLDRIGIFLGQWVAKKS